MSKKISQQFACSKMMLPEHSRSLQEHSAAVYRAENQRRPILDEQKMEELQQVLAEALFRRAALKISIVDQSNCSIVHGVPLRYDGTDGTILLVGKSNSRRQIKVTDIFDIERE